MSENKKKLTPWPTDVKEADKLIKGMAKMYVKKTKCFRQLIEDHNIKLPHDMKIDDMFLNSTEEPEFMDNLQEEYPEYFV